MGNTKLTNNVPPDETRSSGFGNLLQGFRLHPLGVIIDRYYGESHLILALWEGTDQIHSPFSKWPWA